MAGYELDFNVRATPEWLEAQQRYQQLHSWSVFSVFGVSPTMGPTLEGMDQELAVILEGCPEYFPAWFHRGEFMVRVGETANLLGITELLGRKPRALSGGQQQRVAVGRAIVRQPKCYLFDEPLSNLDAKLRLQMRAELKALHLRLKTTTVYVTHDQEEAMTLGERLVVMHRGLIHQIGTPLEVYRRPVNRFVAGFLGSPPMNFIDGRIDRDSGGDLHFKDDHDISVPLTGKAGAERPVGKAVVLGIRPEQFRLLSPSNGDSTPIRIDVTVTEPLGDRMDVYGMTTGGAAIVARVDAGADCRPGQGATFQIDPAAVHLFEPGPAGKRI